MEHPGRWPKSVTYLVWALVVFFVVLIAVTSFWSSASATQNAAAYFSADEIDIGRQYAQQRIAIMWGASLLQLAFYAWLVLSGRARRLANALRSALGGRWLLTVLCVGAFCLLAERLLLTPFSFARLELSRSWGMTDRAVFDWFRDLGIRFLVSLVIQLNILIGLFLLIRWLPRAWWAVAACGGVAFGFAFAFLLPVVVSPLYNTFTPLDQSQWSHYSVTVKRLADRAGLKLEGIYVMDASRRGRHSNAYFTGFGSTQRIVLYDTLLTSHTRPTATAVAGWIGSAAISPGSEPLASLPPMAAHQTQGEGEIETIIAHEIGHWRHRHIVTGICLAGCGALLGFFVMARILRWTVGKYPFDLQAPSDPAAVPLVWLLFILGTWIASPFQNAVSRHFERQADWASLELTEQPEVFIHAEKRLVRENLSNVAPNPVFVWFFSTHPPAVERIKMAEEWRRMHE